MVSLQNLGLAEIEAIVAEIEREKEQGGFCQAARLLGLTVRAAQMRNGNVIVKRRPQQGKLPCCNEWGTIQLQQEVALPLQAVNNVYIFFFVIIFLLHPKPMLGHEVEGMSLVPPSPEITRRCRYS